MLSTSALCSAALLAPGIAAHAGETINQGETLTVSDSSELGVGVVTMNGGVPGATLAFDGNLSIANDFAVTGTGIFDVGGDDITTITGAIADGGGSGFVVKTGDGTLVLSGANTYSVLTNVKGGTLSVTGSIGSSDTVNVNGGALSVSGTVDSLHGTIGYDGDKSGTVTVSGAGASWTGMLDLAVGVDGTGTLTIADGGVVSDETGSVATNSGSTGTVTVTGAGSSWTNSYVLYVGNRGEGTVNVENGGTLTSEAGAIGYSDGSNGTVTISGAGSKWTNNTYLLVGDLGAGALTIADGGTVSSDESYIGAETGSGTATVTGAGSSWINSGELVVGDNSSGTLTIADGGLVSVGTSGSGGLHLARSSGSTGTLNIGAAPSETAVAAGMLVTGEIIFGDGTGKLNFNHTDTDYEFDTVISGAGQVNQFAGVTRFTGDSSGFTGITTITGGTLLVDGTSGGTLGGTMRVENGALGIQNGGVVNSTSDSVVGYDTGDVATANVTGAGSAWVNSYDLFVGDHGTGVLTIAEGGTVSNGNGYLGNKSDGVGTVTVTGADSNWTNSDVLYIGYSGNGTLNVENGGAVSNTAGIVGFLQDSEGSVTVTGTDSKWTNSSAIYIGYDGAGTLNVEAGGTVSNTYGYIGYNNFGPGVATVTGDGSIWANSDDLSVGYGSSGTLTIADGGLVSVGTFGSGKVYVARLPGVTGTLNIGAAPGETAVAAGTLDAATLVFGSGAGTLNFNHTDTDYEFGADISGKGTINHLAGVTTLTGNSSGFSGGAYVDGGTLKIAGSLGGRNGSIGDTAGSSGAAFVTGAGASWTTQYELKVGNFGDGALTIENGGRVVNHDAYLGYESGGSGSATVTGEDSYWKSFKGYRIGVSGAGTLNVLDGAEVLSGDSSYVGHKTGSSGTLNVSGDGSRFDSNDRIIVGYSGVGALNIEDSGVVTNYGAGHLGYEAGASGAATVDGAGSTWTNQSFLAIGNEGAGTLSITNGGAVTSRFGHIAYLDGSSGSVMVDGENSSWINAVELNVGYDGAGALTIANGATVSVTNSNRFAYVARSSDSTGTLNIGAAAGETAVAAGTLDVAALLFGEGTGTLNFNHTDAGYEFAPDISGTGEINQIAGVTKLTGDNSAFSGDTHVTGGALYVNGALGGMVDVTGGYLGGNGTLADVTIGSGGTLAPGNSVGTLNTANLTLAAGSTYEVELNDGGFVAGTNNDLLNASGAVTLDGGAVHVTPENGTDNGSTYALGTYTIITAGSLSGAFDSVSDNFAYLDFAASYDYTLGEAYLTSSMATSFCLSGMSANQCGVGDGAFSLGGGNSVFDTLPWLSDAEAPVALDLLSGEIHASARTMLLEDSRFPREAAMDRLSAALGGEDRASDGFGLWGQGFGSWGQWDGDGNAAAMDRSIGGFLIGSDRPAWDNVRFGLLAGYSRSSFSLDGRSSSGTADSYTLGAYGGGAWNNFTLTGGLANSWHDLDTSRSVAFTGFEDSLSASYNARTLQAWTEAAYRVETGAATFQPFANFAHVNLSTDGFTESGGAAALTSASDSVDAEFTTLGLRAATKLALGDKEATLRGMAAWRHAFGDTPTSQMTFASGGDGFEIAGIPLARDTLVLDFGLDVELGANASLGLAYGGLFGSGVQDQSANLRLNARF